MRIVEGNAVTRRRFYISDDKRLCAIIMNPVFSVLPSTSSAGAEYGVFVRVYTMPFMRRLEIVGQRFTYLVVKEFAFIGKGGHARFLCVCDCGNTVIIPGYRLRNGNTKSCGCYNYRDFGGGHKNARSTPENPVGARSAAYLRMQSNAKIRNLAWDFNLDTWLEIVTQTCFYCGAKPKPYMPNGQRSRYGLFLCNGLDRIDNNKGYTADNVVPCCGTCNGMKSDATQQEFIDRCCRIANEHCAKREPS